MANSPIDRPQIECVLKGEFAALVINNVSRKGVGIDFYEIVRPCYEVSDN